MNHLCSARWRLALILGDLAAVCSRVLRRGRGEAIKGRVVRLTAGGLIEEVAAAHEVILVTGTNGKTTTTSLLAHALRTTGQVEANESGANTANGLVSVLSGTHATRLVLETDEAWLPWAIEAFHPTAVVLLNLSRDQLHRHQEVGRVAEIWRRALERVPLVVANADDPQVVYAASAAPRVCWVADRTDAPWLADAVACPACGALLSGTPGHSGGRREWGCTCGFRRPQPDWELEAEGLTARRVEAGTAPPTVPLDMSLPGAFNRRNAAFAVAAAAALGADVQEAAAAVAATSSVAGRFAVHRIEGRTVCLTLAKNPAGWNELIGLLEQDEHPIVVPFDCDGVDGRDASWLYDVPFERLAGRRIVVTGRRATDMRTRLALAGVSGVESVPSLRTALRRVPAGEVYVVANYTTFQSAQRVLDHAA